MRTFLLYYLIQKMVLISFYLFPDYSSKEFSQGAENPLLKIELEETGRVRFQSCKKRDSMSSEMVARMEGLAPGEGSSQEDRENQEKREKENKLEGFARNLFRNCPEAREIILDSLDLETALACRLVCQEWRETVNYYKKLWVKIKEVFSIAVN